MSVRWLARPLSRARLVTRAAIAARCIGLAVVCSGIVAAFVPACTPAKAPTGGATRPITSWTGEEAQLFDDGIDMGAVPAGTSAAPRDPANEERLGRRVDLADGIVVAKLIGVSSEPVGYDKKRYRLEAINEKTIAGTPLESPFAITVEPDSPAFGTIRGNDSTLMGKKLLVYYKRYAGEDGDVTHYHLSAPTQLTLDLIEKRKQQKQFE